MLVFKFGGASLKSGDAVRNLKTVLDQYAGNLVIVVSAMGKTTNMLEELAFSSFHNMPDINEKYSRIKKYHYEIINNLFEREDKTVREKTDVLLKQLNDLVYSDMKKDFDSFYDSVVSFGEMLSSTIVNEYLNATDIPCGFKDIRNSLVTNENHRDAGVIFGETEKRIKQNFCFDNCNRIITQGYIAMSENGKPTTLGKEGSDYTAAIIAYCLNAEKMVVWKDVPGILNADPKWFSNTVKIDNLSYRETIELAYYGATVIHPKTIKPLENKNIPLYVKSFIKPDEPGTLINENRKSDDLIPAFIFRMNQVLISITSKDLSFIVENDLAEIFSVFAAHKVKINLMQNAATAFSVSVDADPVKIPALLNTLRTKYFVRYNENLELATIRHFNQETIDRVTLNKKIFLEQRTRQNARYLMKDMPVI